MAKLPAELIDRVIDFLHSNKRALAACSLVCKSWIPASRYHLFWELTITSANASLFEPSEPTTTNGVGQPSKVPRGVEIFKYVRNVVCNVDRLTESVMRSIAALPSLSGFSTIRSDSRRSMAADPPLEILKDLKKLSISGCDYNVIPRMAVAIANSPDLDHLCFSRGRRRNGGEMPQLQDLFANLSPDSPPLKLKHLGVSSIRLSIGASIIPHLRSLTSLEWIVLWVSTSDYATSPIAIWKMLASEGIQLSRLKTNVMNDVLLAFLSSYQGLTDLRLEKITWNEDEGSIARRFFEVVLPHHAYSLRVLRIEPTYEGDWCFGNHNLVSITNCMKLEELAVSLFWPKLHDHQDSSPVDLFLNNASRLPRLRLVEIFAAITLRLSNTSCRRAIAEYKERGYTAILNAVKGFENIDDGDDISGLAGYELRVRGKRMLAPRMSAL